jgi:hypothetical protein
VLAVAQTGREGDLVTACPLCRSGDCGRFARPRSRLFFLCGSCGLVFVPQECHLTPDDERARYALHDNHPDDAGYVKYLSTIADEALSLVPGQPAVLDFGSGPNQVLTGLLRQRGAQCIAHDPLYGLVADEAASRRRFDLVVACESLEHLREPRRDIEYIAHCVKPSGFVYAHTRLYGTAENAAADFVADFVEWWYAQDPTHLCFYCGKTMETVAKILGKEIVRTNGKDTVIFGPLP